MVKKYATIAEISKPIIYKIITYFWLLSQKLGHFLRLIIFGAIYKAHSGADRAYMAILDGRIL